MKGLKIIPMFLVLIFFSFVGALFVENNPDTVSIHFFRYVTPPTKVGLVVLCSMMVGMVAAGLLCSVEMLALYMQNKKLRRKLDSARPQSTAVPRSPYRPIDTKTEEKDKEVTALSDDDQGNQNTGSFNPLG